MTFPKMLRIPMLWAIKFKTIKNIKKKKFRDLQHNFKPIECMNKTLEHFIITTHKKMSLIFKVLKCHDLKTTTRNNRFHVLDTCFSLNAYNSLH